MKTLLAGSLLTLLPSLGTASEEALLGKIINAQIEGTGEIQALPNKAVLEFEIAASHVNKEKSLQAVKEQALRAEESLRSILNRRERSLLKIVMEVEKPSPVDNRIGFSRKPGPYTATSRFFVTLQVSRKDAESSLSPRVSSVFDAMAPHKAVNRGILYDVTHRAALEKRATALAFQDAQIQANAIAKRMNSDVFVKQIVTNGELNSARGGLTMNFKQPSMLSIRRGVIVIFQFLSKTVLKVLPRKAV